MPVLIDWVVLIVSRHNSITILNLRTWQCEQFERPYCLPRHSSHSSHPRYFAVSPAGTLVTRAWFYGQDTRWGGLWIVMFSSWLCHRFPFSLCLSCPYANGNNILPPFVCLVQTLHGRESLFQYRYVQYHAQLSAAVFRCRHATST